MWGASGRKVQLKAIQRKAKLVICLPELKKKLTWLLSIDVYHTFETRDVHGGFSEYSIVMIVHVTNILRYSFYITIFNAFRKQITRGKNRSFYLEWKDWVDRRPIYFSYFISVMSNPQYHS